jgi:hypothetical protein
MDIGILIASSRATIGKSKQTRSRCAISFCVIRDYVRSKMKDQLQCLIMFEIDDFDS